MNQKQYALPTLVLLALLLTPLTMAPHVGIGSHGAIEIVVLVGFVGGLAARIVTRMLRG